jgi:hypothetical protein
MSVGFFQCDNIKSHSVVIVQHYAVRGARYKISVNLRLIPAVVSQATINFPLLVFSALFSQSVDKTKV